MPRAGAVYTLPAGNPVVTLSVISSAWANTTMSDIAAALTASAPLDGSGLWTGPVKLPDGAVGTPALTWSNDTASGWYRVSAGDYAFSILGVKNLELSSGFLGLGLSAFTGTLELRVQNTSAVGTDNSRVLIVSSAASLQLFAVNAANAAGQPTLTNGPAGAFGLVKTFTASGPLVFGVQNVLAGFFDTNQNLNLSTTGAAGTSYGPVYAGLPQNVQAGNYTLVLADANKQITRTGGGANTWTIPANAAVVFPIGTMITFINDGAANTSIAITTDALVFAPSGSAGTRTLAPFGEATAVKITATRWYISGVGLT